MHNTRMPTKKILRTQKALLGVLSFGPATGYEIRKFLSETTEHFWKESYGQIYPTLEGLKAESLIAVVDHKTSGRETRRFAIEPQGEAYLREWVRSPQFLCKPGRNELLLKLFSPERMMHPIYSNRWNPSGKATFNWPSTMRTIANRAILRRSGKIRGSSSQRPLILARPRRTCRCSGLSVP
jgi:DNA-binding PadR family transcriptional regulator